MLVKYHTQNLFYVSGGTKRSFEYFPFSHNEFCKYLLHFQLS